MKVDGPHPLRLLIGSFLGLIGVGTLLLLTPPATPPERPISGLDALFTATSAVCVTGLVVRDTGADFTTFGHLVILALIQLGGLGVMTFSLLILSLVGGRASLAQRHLLRQRLAGTLEIRELWSVLRHVARFTIAAEVIGTLLLFSHWYPTRGLGAGLYAAAFHSISAFCNAGFSLWTSSLMGFRGDVFVNLVVCGLIVLGGLGYLVFYDLLETRSWTGRLSLHTKLALAVSGALLLGGTFLIWLLERHGGLAALPPGERVLVSFFQSVSARTAGFNTVEIDSLAPATLFVLVLLMFIGGSPGSCAGGIKTTTFGVLVLAAWCRLGNRRHINVFRRTVGRATLENTLTITVAGAVVLLIGLFTLLLLESPQATVVDSHGVFVGYLFETASALGTVGLSTGVTTSLLPASRLLLVVLMFVGRLGPLTVASALGREGPVRDWRYAEEEVMVG